MDVSLGDIIFLWVARIIGLIGAGGVGFLLITPNWILRRFLDPAYAPGRAKVGETPEQHQPKDSRSRREE